MATEFRLTLPTNYPYELSLGQLLLERKQTQANRNIGQVDSSVLKEGPRTSKLAIRFQVLDGQTRAHHHFVLRLETWSRTKARGWELTKELVLEEDEHDEISKLLLFISSADEAIPHRPGRYLVVDTQASPQIRDVMSMLDAADAQDRLLVAKSILSDLLDATTDVTALATAMKAGESRLLRQISAASRLIEYQKALDELELLVSDGDTGEQRLQALLQRHPWMFGSEYSELLERRVWTRDDQQDFVLRRTVDGFLEIVEIKTPFSEPLLRYDPSHDSYFPSAKLSAVLGQVIRYIEEVERSRDYIRARDQEDPLKIRARVVIGRDRDEPHQKALRSLNAHLHRVEVITFDQLCRIAKRVIAVFENESGFVNRKRDPTPLVDDDLPF